MAAHTPPQLPVVAPHDDSALETVDGELAKQQTPDFTRGFRFWMIMLALGISGILTALEASVISTALPSIVADLGGGELYIWISNGYFLTMTSFQPAFGQISNIFGRRWPFIISTATFILGSGLCGGASNMSMLIAGRVIQGFGAGGMNVLIEIIICDLVPLRERSKYLAMVLGIVSIGTALGPFFGGLIVDYSTWRWIFYLNLPIGGVALPMLVMFLRVRYNKDTSLAGKLSKIDWAGNAIFVASIISILLALAWAGTVYPWSSFRVILPLVLGVVGMVAFLFFEGSRFAAQPMMPLHLFSNRTSFTAFVMTFLHSLVTMWGLYFLPVYFQGVLLSSPSRSGVQLLPTILMIIPAAGLGGVLLSKFGRYKPFHIGGYALMVVGLGLFTLLDASSSTGYWVGFQILESAGGGIVVAILLPAVLAPLAESDTALATATWAFTRTFGLAWGVAIPAAVFNNRVEILAPTHISDPAVAAQMGGGRAYQFATAAFLKTLPEGTRTEVITVLSESLKTSWYVAIGFAVLGFLLVFLEKEVPLRTELETEFGILEESTRKDESKA